MSTFDSGMGDPGMDQPDMQIAVAAVLANNKDVRMLLRVLGTTLQGSLGERVQIKKASGGLLRHKPEEVKAILVRLGDDDYEADIDGQSVRCRIGRSSGGIRIRNESVTVEEWLHRLLAALQVEAMGNQSAQQALQNIIVGQ
ncbi:MAG TPA: hypothetical protein VKV06_00785 [Acidimicrobiales bacterium]|nr:hypothetical protein [Acidimicrobiales bacterium]